jgi:flavin-binding protein dodecin
MANHQGASVDLLGALDEGVDQAAGDAVEHRADDGGERGAS